MRAEKDPVRGIGIDGERGIEDRPGILDRVEQRLQVGSPSQEAEGVALVEIVGRAAPGIAAVTGRGNRLMIDLVEREVVIEEVGISLIVKREAAVASLAVGTDPASDRAIEELGSVS